MLEPEFELGYSLIDLTFVEVNYLVSSLMFSPLLLLKHFLLLDNMRFICWCACEEISVTTQMISDNSPKLNPISCRFKIGGLKHITTMTVMIRELQIRQTFNIKGTLRATSHVCSMATIMTSDGVGRHWKHNNEKTVLSKCYENTVNVIVMRKKNVIAQLG